MKKGATFVDHTTASAEVARELDADQNAKLFAYFKDRHIWLVEPDTDNTEVKPYTPPPDQ